MSGIANFLLLAAVAAGLSIWQAQSQSAAVQSATSQSQPSAAQELPQEPPAQSAPSQSQGPASPSSPHEQPQAGEPQAPATTAVGEKRSANIAGKKHGKKKKTSRAKKRKPPTDGPRRVIVRNGGTRESGGQLEPGLPNAEAQRQRHATQQLLRETDTRVKAVAGRKLTPDQQDMLRQITSYMDQSRSADKDGDLVGARNLAMKAHMLCDELVRQ